MNAWYGAAMSADSNSKNADRSLAQSEIYTLCWRWFAERPFSSNTAILQSRTTCLAGNDTNPLHNPMIPSVIVLEYGLVIYKIYKANGFSGDQPWKSLRQDIRAVPRFEVDLRGAGTRRAQRNLPRSGCGALELVAGKHCQYDTATRNCTL
jgi:hypothetical protein